MDRYECAGALATDKSQDPLTVEEMGYIRALASDLESFSPEGGWRFGLEYTIALGIVRDKQALAVLVGLTLTDEQGHAPRDIWGVVLSEDSPYRALYHHILGSDLMVDSTGIDLVEVRGKPAVRICWARKLTSDIA